MMRKVTMVLEIRSSGHFPKLIRGNVHYSTVTRAIAQIDKCTQGTRIGFLNHESTFMKTCAPSSKAD
jgi:hypothetical protein